jgi:glycosyltransferase involved in cell wall biosynthesis
MACCRPTINEYCTGYPPEAKDCKAIKFVPSGDAAAIVRAVEEYRADWQRREDYFQQAREFFERHLSMEVIEKQLKDIVAEVVK